MPSTRAITSAMDLGKPARTGHCRSVAELHGDSLEQARIGNFIGAANSVDEKGQPVPSGFPGNEHDILTGSTLDGRAYTDNTRDST